MADNAMESRMMQAELLQIIYIEIQALPERFRKILEWSFIEEMTTPEIASRLQMTETHVRVEKSRALVQLRSSLRKRDLWNTALAIFIAWHTIP